MAACRPERERGQGRNELLPAMTRAADDILVGRQSGAPSKRDSALTRY